MNIEENIEEKIYQYAAENKIDLIGIGGVEPFYELENILKARKFHAFSEKDMEKKIHPKLTMEDAESIIVIGEPYYKAFDFKTDGELRGNISMGAVGVDYHVTVKEKLQKLADFLKEFLEFDYKIFSDTGPLVDRELAKRAGIAWQGKNCAMISFDESIGSFFFIGYMLINYKLKASDPSTKNLCGDCNKCIKACPANCLSAYHCDAEKCISYLTQSKEIIGENDKKNMNVQIYGCDICQCVCPFNKNVVPTCTIQDINVVKPKLLDIVNMDNHYFKNVYKKTAAGWRGKKILQRNALVALGNLKTKEAEEILKQFD